MELGGWKSYEMVLRYAHLAPEKLSFVAGRIERQPSQLVDGTLRGENVAKNATLALRFRALRSGKFLIVMVRPERFELPASWFVASGTAEIGNLVITSS
jgi:hypothetical protein